MGIISHPMFGALDLDSTIQKVQPGFCLDARNVIWRGPATNRRCESVSGTTSRANTSLPSGTNKCIFAGYDAVNKQIYDFNWNSNGTHGIYIYTTQTATWQTLIQVGTNTDGDILQFTAYTRIHSMDIIYGDGASGNLLLFIDSLGRCRKLNIQRILSGAYATIKDNFLKVIKAPPVMPPQCVYENDFTATNNNLVNSLFQFSYTWIYDDFEESVLGTAAKQPLPTQPFDPKANTPATSNARISVYLSTGDVNVKKIRLYAKQTTNGITSDWFIVDTLIKANLTLTDNSVYRYLFYNNGRPIPADPTFTTLDFDFVPQQALCQSLLNGDVISYAGVTEGYDFLDPNFVISVFNQPPPSFSANGTLFFSAYNGLFSGSQPQINIYLTGEGTNDGFGNPTTLEFAPQTIIVRAYSNGGDISFTYNNASNSISTILSGLSGAATGAGWIVDATSTNYITIHYPTGTIALQNASFIGIVTSSAYATGIHAFYPNSSYSFGIVERDEDGRTIGVRTNISGDIKTLSPTPGQIPLITTNLSNMKPSPFAKTWRLVRTDSLTYNPDNYLGWVSNSAYSNIEQTAQQQFAYFGLSNIPYYNTQIGSTTAVIGYTFKPGDRIQVLGRYDISGGFTELNLDYSIQGVATNPVINGLVKMGQFIQIAYPTNDINANFAFDGTYNFQNYKILIYSYKAYSPDSQNVYWEIGEEYPINNPGTPSASFGGQGGENTVSLTEGDIFYRKRKVPIVDSYLIPTYGYDQTSPYSTIAFNATTSGSVLDPSLEVNNGVYQINFGRNRVASPASGFYPQFSDGDFSIQNFSANALTVRLYGTEPVTDKTDPDGVFKMYVKVVTSTTVSTPVLVPMQTELQPNVPHSFPFDSSIVIPPNSKIWVLNFLMNEMNIGGFQLGVDIIRNIEIDVFDRSFSDVYLLNTNSDNKPNVINVDAKQSLYNTRFRFSLPYQLDTNIDGINRFYPNNIDEFPKQHGAVIRMVEWVGGKRLRVFQERKVGEVGVYQKFITNQTNSVNLVVSDTIITQNNIQYFEGDFGIGNQADSLGINGYQIYFVDPVRGLFCRVSLNGIDQIGATYLVHTFAGNNLPPYLNNYNYPFGGYASVVGCFNYVKDTDSEMLYVLQPGTQASISYPGTGGTVTQPAITGVIGPSTIPGQTLSFNEGKPRFQGFYDFAPDALVCAENILYSFSGGVMYSHDNTSAYCNFYGQQFSPSVTLLYNDTSEQKKTWKNMWQTANIPWSSPLIYTDAISYGTQRQESKLVDANFKAKEEQWWSAFLRDIHSQKGWVNGQFLKGSLLVAKLQPSSPQNFNYLSATGIEYIDSPLNPKP